MIPAGIIFGATRLAFILLIINLLFAPVILIFLILINLIIDKYFSIKPGLYSTFLALTTIAFFPSIWKVLLRGDVALIGLACTFVAIILFLLKEPRKRKAWNYLIISVPLFVSVLSRRWYSIWALSFFISVAISDLFFVIQKNGKRKLEFYLKNTFYWLLTASFFLILLASAANPLFMRMVKNNYAVLYNPYKYTNTFVDYFKGIIRSVGIYYWTIYFLGLIISFRNKKSRSFGIFITCILFLPIVIFYHFHDFDLEHYYLVAPQY